MKYDSYYKGFQRMFLSISYWMFLIVTNGLFIYMFIIHNYYFKFITGSKNDI